METLMDIEIIKENLKKHSFDSIQGRIWGQRYINYWKMRQLDLIEKVTTTVPTQKEEV
jgi:hypothetical protein